MQCRIPSLSTICCGKMRNHGIRSGQCINFLIHTKSIGVPASVPGTVPISGNTKKNKRLILLSRSLYSGQKTYLNINICNKFYRSNDKKSLKGKWVVAKGEEMLSFILYYQVEFYGGVKY